MLRIEEIVGAMDDEFRTALDALSDERLAELAADKAALRRLRPVGVSQSEALGMIAALQARRAERHRRDALAERRKARRKAAPPRRKAAPAAGPAALPAPHAPLRLSAPAANGPAIRLPAPPSAQPAIVLPPPPTATAFPASPPSRRLVASILVALVVAALVVATL